jgi:hypothetical protein
MNKIILGLLIIVTSQAFAADLDEEAIILNQELQFLQEAAQSPRMRATSQARAATTRTKSLEQTYFGDEQEDSVTTKAATSRRIRSSD